MADSHSGCSGPRVWAHSSPDPDAPPDHPSSPSPPWTAGLVPAPCSSPRRAGVAGLTQNHLPSAGPEAHPAGFISHIPGKRTARPEGVKSACGWGSVGDCSFLSPFLPGDSLRSVGWGPPSPRPWASLPSDLSVHTWTVGRVQSTQLLPRGAAMKTWHPVPGIQ